MDHLGTAELGCTGSDSRDSHQKFGFTRVKCSDFNSVVADGEKPASNLPLTGKSDFTNMNRILDTLALQLLRGYKWAISPIFPPACRYVPTCSEYAMEAVDRYGALRGSLMAGWRLLRCHPFSKGGYDPVVRCSQTNTATGPVRRTKDAFT